MRFNRLLHLIAFSGKAHGGPPASGLDTTKMPDSPALSQATAKASFSPYLPLSGPPPGVPRSLDGLPIRTRSYGRSKLARWQPGLTEEL